MSRLKIALPEYASVPDDFRFTHEDGGKSRGNTLGILMAAVRDYRRINALPMPDDMQAIVEDQLCRTLPPGNCKFMDGTLPATFVNTRFSLDDLKAGMKTLAAVVVSGKTVDKEEANRRAEICAACPANMQPSSACFGCAGVEEVVGAIVGTQTTKSDQYLKVCGACHCFNKTQVWVTAEDLDAGVSDKQMERLELFEGHCWKVAAVRGVRAVKSKSFPKNAGETVRKPK
jgi:hypothetical protein